MCCVLRVRCTVNILPGQHEAVVVQFVAWPVLQCMQSEISLYGRAINDSSLVRTFD